MTNEMIDKFLSKHPDRSEPVKIFFKQRNTIRGIFIQTRDFQELRTKNLWRIVSDARLEDWKRTGDENLARIFNGVDFTRLAEE